MQHHGDWGGPPILQSFAIGANLVAGQVAVRDNTAGTITDPSTVNAYSVAVGVTSEAGTYSTTQGTGSSSAAVYVEAACAMPNTRFRGKVSGGTAADTAFAKALNGNILVNSTASAGGIVISDANVGTSEFAGGMAIALTGQNAGKFRSIASHIDDTSTTVTVPFDYALAVNDEFLRLHAPLQEGVELTTDYVQFNGKPGAGVDLPDTGHAQIVAVRVLTGSGPTEYPKTRHSGVSGDIGFDMLPESIAAPYVEYVFQFIDSVFNHGA